MEAVEAVDAVAVAEADTEPRAETERNQAVAVAEAESLAVMEETGPPRPAQDMEKDTVAEAVAHIRLIHSVVAVAVVFTISRNQE